MSGNRPGDGNNRQRIFSATSNASSSSYKDNSFSNHRESLDRRPTTRSSSNTFLGSAAAPSGSNRRLYQFNSSVNHCDSQRAAASSNGLPFEASSFLNHQSEGTDTLEIKRQYENLISQIQQLHPAFVEDGQHPPPMRMDSLPNNEALFMDRAVKLQEAQQRLIQLQELMQNVSLELDCNPYGHLSVGDNKNKKLPKESQMDFLRNVPSINSMPTAPRITLPRVSPHNNSAQANRESRLASGRHLHSPTPQNNLSHESINPKRPYASSNANGSLLDVFGRSEPSFDSSDADDHPIGPEEEENVQDVNSSQDPLLQPEVQNTSYRVPLDRLDRLEQQLDRTHSLCELFVMEQRRLSLITESLFTAVSNMQSNVYQQRPSSFRSYPGFTLSGLPVNSSWNDPTLMPCGGHQSTSDFQTLAHTVTQCCHMINQLQRDLVGVQQSLDSSNPQVPEAASSDRVPDAQHNPFRELPKSTRSSGGSSYDCNMDRFDPQVTLNNRVPPGTRTNNYWDNFRSYSRQNLLSSGPSNVSNGDHQNGLPEMHLLHPGLPVGERPVDVDSRVRGGGDSTYQAPRRTKRKVNKGQRQMEIGVHCPPHADNRALAYGLMSVRRASSTTNGSTAVLEVNPIGRNLNRQAASSSANETAAPSIDATSLPEASGGGNSSSVSGSSSKVAKDTTTTLKYSGARPKENRRPQSELNASTSPGNVNLLAERELQDKAQGLESIIRVALTEHAGRPHFLTQLLELLHKFDSDPLRQMALNALQDCVTETRPPPHHQPADELMKVFNGVTGHQRDLTPQLLESFLTAIQLPVDDTDHDEVEGATAAGPAIHTQDENGVYLIRQALTPFLFRRLSEVQSDIQNTLSKFETAASNQTGREVTAAATSTPGREDDLAEADQSCDQSCDGMVEANVHGAGNVNEETSAVSHRHSAVGLDEVPTRLMAILVPPVWSSNSGSINSRPQTRSPVSQDEPARSNSNSSVLNNNNSLSNQPNATRQRTAAELESIRSCDWFPEDNGV